MALLEALPMERWAEIGRALARAGLTERAMKQCFGVAAVAHVPRAIAAGRTYGERPTPAAVAPWLAAGGRVHVDVARRALGDLMEDLERAALLVRDGELVRLDVRLWPCGSAIVVGDGDVAPDDSSHHLLGALPARRPARWLDLGTGAAWAPLAAPWRAGVCVAADLDPQAIALGRVGAALAGRDDLDLRVADLDAGIDGTFDLVTCNAPIPAPGDGFLARMWDAIARRVAPGGAAIVHSVLEHEPPAGALTVARYTPAGVRGFGVSHWRPEAGDRRVVEIALTVRSPHVTRDSVGT